MSVSIIQLPNTFLRELNRNSIGIEQYEHLHNQL